MSTRKAGGPAFPQNTQVVANAGQVLHTGFMGGMTLRDYFAAKVMQALVEGSFTKFGQEQIAAIRKPDETLADMTAATAYRFADAMLEARKS